MWLVVGWFGLKEKMCVDELLMEEGRLEGECERSFLSSGGIALRKLCLHMTYALSSLRPALTWTFFPTPPWSNQAQALLRVTIYAPFIQPHYATSLFLHY